MTGQEILNAFHTYIDDQSELSTQEELDLLNTVYQDIYRARHWEWLKKQASGNSFTSFATNAWYVNLPADFIAFSENNNQTDNTFEPDNNAQAKVVFCITPDGIYHPYQIVNFSDRRQYLNKNGFCYVDYANSRIVFTQQPVSQQYEFDYIFKPPALTLINSPVFDDDFHCALFYAMASDHSIISLFDRAHSYAAENRMRYKETLDLMAWDNAQKLLN